MVQSINESLGYPTLSKYLPAEYCEEITAKLRRYPSFKWSSTFLRLAGKHPQRAIERWNDRPWRRQKTVVKVLAGLALDHRPPPQEVAVKTTPIGEDSAADNWSAFEDEFRQYVDRLKLVRT